MARIRVVIADDQNLVREGLARVSARVPLTRLAELQRAEAEAPHAEEAAVRDQ